MTDEIQFHDESNDEYTPPAKVRSVILAENEDQWIKVEDKLPLQERPVMIRIVDDSKIYGHFREAPEYAIAAEDIKIGYCTEDPETGSIEWFVCPPHPMYDYSPLSEHAYLKSGARVSHWRDASQEDLDSYDNRFDIIGDYTTLNLEVDNEHEETVYRALLWGATFINDYITQAADPKDVDEFKKLYNTLCDLQCCIDRQCCIRKGHEGPIYNPDMIFKSNAQEGEKS